MLMISLLEVGSVLRLPIDESRSGVAQVVGKHNTSTFYFGLFKELVPPDASDEDFSRVVADSDLLLLAPSFDGKVHSGAWSIVGHRGVRDDIALPAYKIGTPGHYRVVDFAGRRAREVTDDEAGNLEYMTVVAPVRLERALAANAGVGDWLAAYDGLFPPKGTTAKYFP